MIKSPKLTATAISAIVVASIAFGLLSSVRTTSKKCFMNPHHQWDESLPDSWETSSFDLIRSCSGAPKCKIALSVSAIVDSVDDSVVVDPVVAWTVSGTVWKRSSSCFSWRFCSSRVRNSSTISSCVVVDFVVLGLVLGVGLGLRGRLLPGLVTIAGARTFTLVVIVVEVVLVVVLVVVVVDFSVGFNCCLKSSRFFRKSSICTVLIVVGSSVLVCVVVSTGTSVPSSRSFTKSILCYMIELHKCADFALAHTWLE